MTDDTSTTITPARAAIAQDTLSREMLAAAALGSHYWVAHLIYAVKVLDPEEFDLLLDLENLRSAPVVSCLMCGDDNFSPGNIKCPGM